MEVPRRACPINDPYALSGERLFQHGKGKNRIRALGEAKGSIPEEVKLLENHPDLAIVQHADEGDRGSNASLLEPQLRRRNEGVSATVKSTSKLRCLLHKRY